MFPTAALMNRSWCNRSRVTGILFYLLAFTLIGCAVSLYFSNEDGDAARYIRF